MQSWHPPPARAPPPTTGRRCRGASAHRPVPRPLLRRGQRGKESAERWASAMLPLLHATRRTRTCARLAKPSYLVSCGNAVAPAGITSTICFPCDRDDRAPHSRSAREISLAPGPVLCCTSMERPDATRPFATCANARLLHTQSSALCTTASHQRPRRPPTWTSKEEDFAAGATPQRRTSPRSLTAPSVGSRLEDESR